MTGVELPETWAEAANLATFAFFEMAAPTPRARWAGGWGSHGEQAPCSSIGIVHDVDGVEVSVTTETRAAPDHLGWKGSLPMMVHMLVSRAILGSEQPHELPFSLVVDRDDRTISVDGVERRFSGVRLTPGSHWTGWATVDGGHAVQIEVDGPVLVEALVTCRDWAAIDSLPPLPA